MGKKINFTLFKSIIDAYREKKITRERFVYEWANAQRSLGIPRVLVG